MSHNYIKGAVKKLRKYVTARNFQFLLILAPPPPKEVVTRRIFACTCTDGNACLCFGSESKRDQRMNRDEVFISY